MSKKELDPPRRLTKRTREQRGLVTSTPEERAEIARRNGMLGGRPLGSKNSLPLGTVKALRAMKMRVPQTATPEEAEIAGWAFERMCQATAGLVHSRRAPTVLKGAIAIREEVCGPLVKETRISGGLSLASAVAAAAGRIEGK